MMCSTYSVIETRSASSKLREKLLAELLDGHNTRESSDIGGPCTEEAGLPDRAKSRTQQKAS